MNWFVYKWELFRVKRRLHKIKAPYDKRFKQEKKNKNKDAIKVYGNISFELHEYAEKKQILHTNYLRSLAHKLDVPFPWWEERSELWTQTKPSSTHVLNTDGKHEVRKRIREEKRARREPFLAWAGWLVGILGALTGLASVLSK